jgi:hypothetical protein
MQCRLHDSEDDLDLTGVVHLGADALVGDREGKVPGGHSGRSGNTETRLAEVLQWPLGRGETARYAFDAESLLLARITVGNSVSGVHAVIRLSDHRDIGGVVRPCTIEVQGDGFAYRDTLGDWEVSP